MRDITSDRLDFVKTSDMGGRTVVGGDLESAFGFVLLPLDHPVVEPGPLRVARVKLLVGKLPHLGPPPRLGRKTSQRARPSAPLVLVAVGMQAGKGVGQGAPCAEESGLMLYVIAKTAYQETECPVPISALDLQHRNKF